MVVVEAKLLVDALPTAPDVVTLEEIEFEKLLVVLKAVEVIDAAEVVETVLADGEDCPAELGTTYPVLVYCSPVTPIIVCAVPSETWNVPAPVLQLQVPSALSG
jgi:hypothetical protein